MKIKIIFFLVPLFFSFDSLIASSSVLSFDEAVVRVLDQSFTLGIKEEEIREKEGMRRQSYLFSNPVFSYLIQPPNDGGEWNWRQESYFITQLIPINGQKQKKSQAASAQYKAAWMDYEISKLSLIHRLHKAFIRTLAAQHLVELAREKQQLAVESFSLKMGPTENYKKTVENALAQLNVEKALLEWQTAQHALALFWGCSCPDFQAVSYPFFGICPPSPIEDCLKNLSRQAEIEKLDYEYEAASYTLEAEKRGRIPDPTLALGYQYQYRGESLLIGVSFPLPIWNRNQGLIQTAYANREKIEKQREELWLLLKGKLINAHFELVHAYQEAETLHKLLETAAQLLASFSLKDHPSKETEEDRLTIQKLFFELKEKHIQSLVSYHEKIANIYYLNSQSQ